MSDEPKKPEARRWSTKAKTWFAIALFAFYVLSSGPAHLFAWKTGNWSPGFPYLLVYRPLFHAAEGLDNVSRALSFYVHLFVPTDP
ncbi:MAG TPA: hypothetical protein VFG04_30820 [Planctomycetaceae bacterium]|jgi:hypothetical protein|nr:hypothetical protein [Planctomycetaceae bacterium]